MRGGGVVRQSPIEEDSSFSDQIRTTTTTTTNAAGIIGGVNSSVGVGVGIRKKSVGVRTWLLIDSTGQTQVIEVGKHSIMKRTGLPARDLRILDPILAYPSTVLGREKAIVINLEHIKSIITAQEVLLLNSKDPSVIPFVDELQRRLLRLHHQSSINNNQVGRRVSGDVDRAGWTDLYDSEEGKSPSPSRENDDDDDVEGNGRNGDGPKVLPFEFVALEACLEAACTCLEIEATTLEQEAHPALDKLTSKISTLNLERVRQIKSRLVAITGRVQKVRDELEHLLDDDDDMAEMYLTDKMLLQRLDESSSSLSSINGRDGMDDGAVSSDVEEGIRPECSLVVDGVPNNYEGELQNILNPDHLLGVPNGLSRNSHGTLTSTTHSGTSKHLDVEELEMLLEAYFVQIDGTLNKLSTLREYVDDTEDYINIMLDDKQNHLLQMGVMLTTATLVVSAFVVLVGVFGMNINIELYNKNKGMSEFFWTVGGGVTGTVFLYVIAIAWCKHKRLLE
ncbi:hypothetical protein AQUCO_06000051v1 [Aquilegia coerulea]|uniref:Magnesium transporter n=1 Tax=Aquilegia coerulea TaxID=218851 RepID=A0A2G5CDR0_AQUCA|nr:hypothetical protein AQUCO_06000051v1 [Aquilegia coerulea]